LNSRAMLMYNQNHVSNISVVMVVVLLMFDVSILPVYSWTTSITSIQRCRSYRSTDIISPTSQIHPYRNINMNRISRLLYQAKKDDSDNDNDDTSDNFIKATIKTITSFKPSMFIDQKTFVNLSVGAVAGVVLSLSAVLGAIYSDDPSLLPSIVYSSSTVDQMTTSKDSKVRDSDTQCYSHPPHVYDPSRLLQLYYFSSLTQQRFSPLLLCFKIFYRYSIYECLI